MDGKAPLVSVVMSVFNGGQWLQAAIDSIVQQTYTNWEFVIIDDASNDDTKTILNAYSQNPKFKIITNQQNKGLTKNLNTGIALSKGEFIARMDADDISVPDRFAKQVAYLQSNPGVEVVSSFIEFIDENGHAAGQWDDDRNATNWKKIKRKLPWYSCVAHPTVIIRKTVFENYKYNESQQNSQDWDLWLQLAADDKVIKKINESLLFYRVHKQSMTAGSLKKSAFRKMHNTYRNYLQLVISNRKFNLFNLKVFFAFLVNIVKLLLSTLKRAITS